MAKILVVDDEAGVVDFLRDLLVDAGHEVDSAMSAEEALQRIRETIYDAALLDFNLPDMDGVMLHRQIRQMDGELAAHTVFMSGMVQSDSNLGYYAAHGGGFLAKPFDVADVLEVLSGILGTSSPG